ncbi:MAG: carbohydrate kinase family protein [Patescibacteria group bacterium]
MKIAVLGPVAKDCIKIDNNLSMQIGGIPYYVAVALKSLGVEKVKPYVTCGSEDTAWVKENFSDIDIECLPAEKTLESDLEYSSDNPDIRKDIIKSYPNTIEPNDRLLKELEEFDYIIFGPLFHDDISRELFIKLKHKNLVLGNFGMFTYGESGKFVRKNPENLIEVLPFLKYLFLDKGEAEFVSGENNVNDAARYLQAHGLIDMIITEGSKGSHLFLENNYYKIPAFLPDKIVDPTGAGDTYLAAFIRALELFDDPVDRGRFAAMVATMSLEEKGAFRSSVKNVLARLESQLSL